MASTRLDTAATSMQQMKRVGYAVLLAAALSVPVEAQVLGPLVVTDPSAEPTWIQTLVQGISTATSLKNIAKIELQNVLPTAAGWAADARNPQLLMAPLFTAGTHELAVYQGQVETNTGAPPAPNQALNMAQTGMNQIPQDEDDLANAQAASDECTGDLCAQQTGHRFQQIQLTNAIEQRQFDYARYQEQVKGETAATAWMTTPNHP